MPDVIYEMSRKGLGMTCVVDGDGALLGIITDGDLRRKMAATANVLELTARRRDDAATRSPSRRATLAAEALHILEQRKITVDRRRSTRDRSVEGVVHLHDLWRTELV